MWDRLQPDCGMRRSDVGDRTVLFLAKAGLTMSRLQKIAKLVGRCGKVPQMRLFAQRSAGHDHRVVVH